MSGSTSTYTMKFSLIIEKRLFIGIAISFIITSIALLLDQSFFVGLFLLLTGGIILTYYFKENQIKNKKKKDMDQDKPEYTPQHKLFSPCSM